MPKVKERHQVFRQASIRQTRLRPHKVIYVHFIFVFIFEKYIHMRVSFIITYLSQGGFIPSLICVVSLASYFSQLFV